MLLGALALGGCGLRPVYAPGGGLRRGSFAFDTAQTEQGFLMLRALEDRLGAPVQPRYRLKVEVTQDQETSFQNPGQSTFRRRLHGSARWILYEGAAQLADGRALGFVSLSAGGSPFANAVATDDAAERLVDVLAERVVQMVWAQI